jgi:uncharacterized protein (TIGR03000 family)
MTGFHRASLFLAAPLMAIAGPGTVPCQAGPPVGGHGGGAGHIIAARGWPGWHGYHGWGYGYRGWGWPYYGYGFGFGVGLGVGYGLGYGYGYPYYGYGYPYYDFGYPYYQYPNGYAVPAGGAGSPPPVYAAPAPAPYSAAAPPVGPTVLAARMRNYPPAAATDTDVSLIVRVPAEAVVWVNGTKTSQTGPRREFVSSGLAPGQSYSFLVRAQWTGPDGKPATSDQRISVRAGERRALDFGEPSPRAAEVIHPVAAGGSN